MLSEQTVEFLKSPWADQFELLIQKARSSLLISSPYIGRGPCDRIVALTSQMKAADSLSFLLLTDLSPQSLLSGSTDVSALYDISGKLQVEVRFLPSIHAKIYVADEKIAVITSANMTDNGLLNNCEYGVKFQVPDLVRVVRHDLVEYARLGTIISRDMLKFLAQTSVRLAHQRDEAERKFRYPLLQEFHRQFESFREEVLRARVGGRAPHAIFADAILYLLQRGPISTADLHSLIQRIHPDLCDDTVDRVIDGKHFGKKWKHAVRTAQQHLKQAGSIELKRGKWQLRK